MQQLVTPNDEADLLHSEADLLMRAGGKQLAEEKLLSLGKWAVKPQAAKQISLYYMLQLQAGGEEGAAFVGQVVRRAAAGRSDACSVTTAICAHVLSGPDLVFMCRW